MGPARKPTRTRTPTARDHAVRILSEVEKDPFLHASERVHRIAVDEKLNKRDRRFLHELVGGVLRRRLTLDSILSAYSSLRLDDTERAVRQVLRIGAYQLLYLDGIPPFAAVSSAVDLVHKKGKARAFVNAVLRKLDDECRRVRPEKDRGGASPRKRLQVHADKVAFFSRAVFPDPEEDVLQYRSAVFSHPRALVERWTARYGEEQIEALLAADNLRAPTFVRVDRRLMDREAGLEALRAEGVRCEPGPHPASVRVFDSMGDLVHTPSFRRGVWTVQDVTAMGVAPLLMPQPGERLLDLCAAPGGKTTHLLELVDGPFELVATDRDQRRIQRLLQNLERARAEQPEVRCLDLLGDPQGAAELGDFDGILVDAPCSNSGVFRRRPEARYRFADESLKGLCAKQDALLDAALCHLRPGGRLVYSTCSIEPEENEQRVAALLQRHPGLRVEEQWEKLPEEEGGDGGFACRLRSAPPGLE